VPIDPLNPDCQPIVNFARQPNVNRSRQTPHVEQKLENSMGATKTVTEASFATDVEMSDKPVIVDFWAEWCGPCKMVAPVLEEIAAAHADKITIAKLNVDENPGISAAAGITSIPTLNVYVGGKVVKQIIGAKPKAALLADLAEFL